MLFYFFKSKSCKTPAQNSMSPLPNLLCFHIPIKWKSGSLQPPGVGAGCTRAAQGLAAPPAEGSFPPAVCRAGSMPSAGQFQSGGVKGSGLVQYNLSQYVQGSQGSRETPQSEH